MAIDTHPLDSLSIAGPTDVEVVEQLWSLRSLQSDARLADVDLLVLDFDGVLTDNAVFVTEDGKESVRVDRGDGWGVARLLEAGVEVVIMSTEHNPVVSARARKLRWLSGCMKGPSTSNAGCGSCAPDSYARSTQSKSRSPSPPPPAVTSRNGSSKGGG